MNAETAIKLNAEINSAEAWHETRVAAVRQAALAQAKTIALGVVGGGAKLAHKRKRYAAKLVKDAGINL